MTFPSENLCAENVAELYKLYRSVYGRDRQPGFYELKYAVLYPGYPPQGRLAFDSVDRKNRKAIGFYGAIPCYLNAGEEKCIAAQCVDAMTHPGFRRRGIFLQLASETVRDSAASGIRLLFGFPNQFSLPGFQGAPGWKSAQRMDCFRVPVKTIPLKKIAQRLPLTGSFYKRYADFIIRKYERRKMTRPEISAAPASAICRDEAWLYSKTGMGMREIDLEGIPCFIRPGEELMIGDLETGAATADRQIPQLKRIAARLGLGALQFHSSPGSGLHQALAKLVDPVPSFTVVYHDLGSGLDMDRLSFSLADIDIF